MFGKVSIWFSGVGTGMALCVAATVYNSSQKAPDWDPIPGYILAAIQLALSLIILGMGQQYQSYIESTWPVKREA